MASNDREIVGHRPVVDRRGSGGLTTGEVLAIALNRSRMLIAAALLAGLVSVVLGRQLQGPEYQATARVEIGPDVVAIVADAQQTLRDPARAIETERIAAGAHEFYEEVAKGAEGELRSTDFLEGSVRVTGGQTEDVLEFTAEADRAALAIRIANEVATAFPPWRAKARALQAEQAIKALRARPASEGDQAERDRLISHLELLRDSTGGVRVLGRAVSATKTRPTPIRDGLVGLALGLVVALGIVGIREALRTRVRTAHELEDLVGAPVLAAIPPAPARGRLPLFGSGQQGFGPLYRALAAGIEREAGTARPPVVGMTGVLADDAAATVAATLAVALARTDEPITVIDLDVTPMRRGVAEILGADRGSDEAGAWSVEVRQFSATLQPLPRVQLATTPGLCVLEAGSREERLPEMLGGQTDAGPARPGWTIVVLPPALQSGAVIDLSAHLDGVVVVARQDSVQRRDLRALRDQSASWSAPLLGAVLADAVGGESFAPDSWPWQR